MKKQNSFISSSGGYTRCYYTSKTTTSSSTKYTGTSTTYTGLSTQYTGSTTKYTGTSTTYNGQTTAYSGQTSQYTGTTAKYTGSYTTTSNHSYDYWSTYTHWTTYADSPTYSIMTQSWDTQNIDQNVTWNTYASTSYQRIEYFLEATEKLNEPYSKNGLYYQNLTNYAPEVAKVNVYDGFVDLVITFPVKLRIAGIELFNPWVGESELSETASYWKYLPKKFKIYKVDDDQTNDALNSFTYENDIARTTNYNEEQTIRPIKYDLLDNDSRLVLLGNYSDINWKSIGSLKCFFKFNPDDPESANVGVTSSQTGTATWECKQLVIRIFETNVKHTLLNKVDSSSTDGSTFIMENVYQYILEKELMFGTKYAGESPTVSQAKTLLGKSNISKLNNPTDDPNWEFGENQIRSYDKVSDVKFISGIEYKLGGIQLLFAPDIFSISEMKMYNYAGRANKKVYIGEWKADDQMLVYYGTKTTKVSDPFDIDDLSVVEWHHDFNVPTKYLDCKLYAKFKMKYDTFNAGDVVTNITNLDGSPLSIKITSTTALVNLSNGVAFINPETGESVSFKDGFGVQMDREGNFDALRAAIDVKATVVDAGSTVSAEITGDCPFQLYFVVKRLF